ncbi:hydroquinone glucosyltransferase [Cannabis sativa]|nr:hydroquinone glucosyltransferase [Cannabis sativa]
MTMDKKTHIAIFPSPGVSHLIPFVEFAKRLVLLHNFHVTCFILTTTDDYSAPSPAKKAILDSLPATIDIIYLPPAVNFDDLPKDSKPASKLSLIITHSLSSLQTLLNSLLISSATNSTPLTAFFADPFGVKALEVARGLNISTFIFFPTNAAVLSLLFHLPMLDKSFSCRFMRDLPDLIKLPGCAPLHGKDVLEPIQDRQSETYKSFLNTSKEVYLTEGIIINSFSGIESEAIKALQANEGMLPIFPVGPIVQIGPTNSNTNGSEYCLSWLDKQPSRSVLYVSFGSGGTLSSDQMTELAFGLEMSGQKFLWVVRKPDNESANAAYLKDSQSQFEAIDVLPQGFLERTKGRGLVVQSWAPQTLVLSHGSTGGFLCHCGWSSTLESIVEGIPLIAWPLFAEQKMNAVMLVDGLEVALRPITVENGIVGRDEIARVVKVLMDPSCEEGKKVRDRMNELKDAAAKALSHDGSSTRALSDLAFTLRSKASN